MLNECLVQLNNCHILSDFSKNVVKFVQKFDKKRFNNFNLQFDTFLMSFVNLVIPYGKATDLTLYTQNYSL